jgi:hypothetical protein
MGLGCQFVGHAKRPDGRAPVLCVLAVCEDLVKQRQWTGEGWALAPRAMAFGLLKLLGGVNGVLQFGWILY